MIEIGNIKKSQRDINRVRLEFKCPSLGCGSFDYYAVQSGSELATVSEKAEVSSKLFICTNCRKLFMVGDAK